MRADGRRARRLTRAERFELRPRWSPDGRWIAFVSDAADDDVERAVYVIPARGGPRRRVVAGGFDGFSWQPVRR